MSKSYFPLHVHTHYSLLDGLSKPEQVAKRCIAADLPGSAMTDHGNISGAITFSKALQNKNLKPIIGCEFYICQDDSTRHNEGNRHHSHLLLLAKNLNGWRELIEITSIANERQHFYYKPRLDLATISELPHDNIIAFSGHYGSTVTGELFEDIRAASTARSELEAKSYLRSDMDRSIVNHIELLQAIFPNNFFLEVQKVDSNINPASSLQSNINREIAKKLQVPTIATPDAHYAFSHDAPLQRILLCTSLGNTTLADVRRKLQQKENIPLGAFFKSSQFHIPSYEEMINYGNTPEELAMTLEVASMCEDYDLTGKPMLPKYSCPDGMDSLEYLRELCRAGFKKQRHNINRVIRSGKATKEDYRDRFEKEFRVLGEAGLADYFLIVRDFVMFARDNDILVGAGRGSAAGSLILYLLGVTYVDPIEYDLIFERFYNAGRNTKDRVSLPDIDMDFEKEKRGVVIDYIKNRFGHDHVAQLITFSRMQGRAALKDVLRTRGACSANEMNRITEFIPGEEEISDQLQDMRDADKKAGGDGEASIIQWALENHPEELKEWAYLNDKGEIEGPMSVAFQQSIAIEGTKRSQGRHPGGIIISSEPLRKVCPMVYDSKSEEPVAGMEMGPLEEAGHVKFDILGVALLDKLHGVQNLLRTGTL